MLGDRNTSITNLFLLMGLNTMQTVLCAVYVISVIKIMHIKHLITAVAVMVSS